jgi:hypothetical protein
MVSSLSVKFIGESFLEGALFAPTTFQVFKLIVAWTSFPNFQLIDNLFLYLNCERARAATICNESFELIDASNADGVRAPTLRLPFGILTAHLLKQILSTESLRQVMHLTVNS